ncbi:hypothetical protein [Janthinobacterium sp. LB3P118]|uniref:hypothetical protein n=1 Tax=Janthinobacterium sp. LB3P118 TaxID=3424195 RepID=UPI003F26DDCB
MILIATRGSTRMAPICGKLSMPSAADAGFDLHLTKPVDFYELDALLQKMLQAQ